MYWDSTAADDPVRPSMETDMKARPAIAHEIIATSLLLGETPPIDCHDCNATGAVKTFFGQKRCGYCDGLGVVFLGKKTSKAFGVEWYGFNQKVRKRKKNETV